jgi:hypothetical protein
MRVLPSDEWRILRLLVFSIGSALVLLAASGLLNSTLFSAPDLTKYGVTVFGTVFIVWLATVREPLRPLVGLAIVVAPFNFVLTFSGIQVTPLLAVELLAVFASLPRHRVGSGASLAIMAPVFALLLVPGILGAGSLGHWVAWLIVTFAMGWLTYLVASEPGGRTFVVSALALSALIQGGLAIWEFHTGHRLNLYVASGSTATGANSFFKFGSVTRASGALPDPIGLGQFLALCIPLVIALATRTRRLTPTLAALVIAGVASVGLVLSLSRMSLIGAVVGVLVAILLLPGRARWTGILGVIAVGAVAVVLGLSLGGKSLELRVQSIFHPTAAHVSTAAGDQARLRIWRGAEQIAEAHLVTGVGFGNITHELPLHGVPVTGAAHAHNTYLQLLAEGGVLALLGLLALIVSSFTDLAHAFSRHRIWVAGAAGSLVATLISWTTDVEIRYIQVSAIVAMLIGLIAALADAHEPRADEQPTTEIPRPPHKSMLTSHEGVMRWS